MSTSSTADAHPDAGAFLESLHARAARQKRTILFPEATDPRTASAVNRLNKMGSVHPVLVRRGDAPTGVVPSNVTIVDPLNDPRVPRVVEHLLARRGSRGLTREDAERLARDPLYFADSLVALGEADGCVAGAVHTTADVL
ncbi:phosphate acyltransferase, partial [Gemmatimonas sp.]|uniref:phosphate acyltransferase n=1 Tax=Gemmatimonas sp. TaxID=1962908 RepID=UPI0037C16A58